MKISKVTGAGFSHIAILLVIIVLAIVGLVGWRVATVSKTADVATSAATASVSSLPAARTSAPAPVAVQKDPDSASSIDSPQKITTSDGKQYFYYGEPAGQNNASPKRIFITLHGTGGSAEKDYDTWKPYIKETTFALATLNWWDGSGDTTADYNTPSAINSEVHDFLASKGYKSSDVVVFEGFSRGSANSYSVVALDRASSNPVIDVAVSSSGGVQASYYDSTTKTIASQKQAKIFEDVYWILACGSKDPNPSRDGCEAMETAKSFVSGRGASVLGLLSDPNAGHGALTTSNLNLPKQMFELIDQKF